ncbi:hypothetical protein B296_00046551 [Ensete ventricosum]|uniref:Uncharacterized protein n=1 Tax=Ensete ventricosum TaxID=4639 RepID=A0A426YFB4_ENSVE|nr:hypothetical protein B296_00046551 [Ensete ventricosum]
MPNRFRQFPLRYLTCAGGASLVDQTTVRRGKAGDQYDNWMETNRNFHLCLTSSLCGKEGYVDLEARLVVEFLPQVCVNGEGDSGPPRWVTDIVMKEMRRGASGEKHQLKKFSGVPTRGCLCWPVCASSPAVVSVRSWSSRIGRNLGVRLGKSAAGVVERGSEGGSTGARAYIVGVVDHPYLATWLPLWLTMLSHTSTMPIVLAVGHASAGKGVDLTCVRPTVRSLAPPYLCPASFPRRVDHVGGPIVRGRADRELGNLNSVGADPTEQELGNLNGAARADPTEQELGNYDVARADLTEQELGNWDVTRADPTEQELENWDVARADPTEQELGNWNDFCRG